MTSVRLLLPDGTPVDLETHGEDDYLTRRLRSGWYELDLLKAIRARAGAGIYVDAGAHIGALSTIRRDHPLIAVEAMTDAEWARTSRHPALLGYRLIGRYCASPTYLMEHP